MNRRAGWEVLSGAAALTVLLLTACGCGDYGVATPAGDDAVSVALPRHLGGGTATLFLYRAKSAATGERMGVGRRFEMGEERQVRAVLEFKNVRSRSPFLIHFMWLNPDGDEIYTKEIYIHARDWNDSARRDSLEKAHVTLDPKRQTVTVESRFGISPARLEEEFHKEEEQRSFKVGTWEVRTYLFRQMLVSTTFDLEKSSGEPDDR